MDSLNHDNQADVIEAFNSTSRYLDDLLNIDNPYFEGMVNQIYPSELQLNKGNISDTEAPFLDLHLSVANGFVSSKIYDKRDDFDFDIVNFPFLARLHEVHRAIAVTPVVHVPVPVRVRVTLALKFSRSPYLDNHSSESIHTWTIDTL